MVFDQKKEKKKRLQDTVSFTKETEAFLKR